MMNSVISAKQRGIAFGPSFRSRRQRGIGLIEVLIALLILSIGILGVLAFQLSGKRANFDALQRTVALQLAEDIMARMRNNAYQTSPLSGVEVYLKAGGIGTTTTTGGMTTLTLNEDSMPASAPTPSCFGGTVECSAAELAVSDLYEWGQALRGESVKLGADADNNRVGGLVRPTGCISGPGDGSGYVVVTVVWRGAERAQQPAGIDCGGDTGFYDDDSGDNLYRRHVTARSYIVGLEP